MKEELGKIALAGLLHDIGKFAQRAGETADGRKEHAALGDKFVQQFVPECWRGALAPVGWHHGDPEGSGADTYPVWVVMVADRLSAGEREHREEEELHGPVPLMVSPFSRLAGGEFAGRPAYLPLAPLVLKPPSVFALTEVPAEGEWRKAYEELWRAFCQEAFALSRVYREQPNLEAYLLSLSDLLLRYTWCIPSAFYYDVADVSLYDHLRTTAALAVCVFEAFRGASDQLRGLLEALRGKDPSQWPEGPAVAALVEGDVSGIQDFLYGLRHPKGAAAILRARSFYIQMLSEVLARWILRQLELPPANLLYCGGGRFRLLVPPAHLDRLEEMGRKINQILLRAHGGALYLALAGVPLAPAHFGPAAVRKEKDGWKAERGFRLAEDELNRKITTAKDRRFLELPGEFLREIFIPYGGEHEVCHICGAVAPTELEDDLRWCASCKAFRELGRELRAAEFVRIIFGEPRDLSVENQGSVPWTDVFAAFGCEVQVSDRAPAPENLPALVYRLSDTDFQPRTSREAVVRKFLVNVVARWKEGEPPPRDEPEYKNPGDGEVKHFGVLARQSQGAPLLGVLRMDMDNLGRLFRDGFIVEKNGDFLDRGTFSRKQSLSTLLSVFFEGWVGEIIRSIAKEEGSERIYAVYSGGDDLFLVGAWDAVLVVAERVRTDFQGFSKREDLGISAGLVLVSEKHPLYLVAKEAGKALDSAKDWRGEKSKKDGCPEIPKKDAVCFLGTVLGWEEFPEVRELKDRLVAAIREEEAARRVLFVLQEVWDQYQREAEKRGPWGPWIWRTVYWLARQREMARRHQKSADLYDFLLNLVSAPKFMEKIPKVGLAARWAELETKKEVKGEGRQKLGGS
ncbi:MAG: type III-A CRISPR-associated protein Cas10/Csm1 [Candidatus Bipolaricaulaceae bacterium]